MGVRIRGGKARRSQSRAGRELLAAGGVPWRYWTAQEAEQAEGAEDAE